MSEIMTLQRPKTAQEIVDTLIAMLQTYTKTTDTTWNAETTLAEVGIDSFDYVDFVFKIEDEFKIDIDFNANKGYSDMQTIGDVARATRTLILAAHPA